MSHVSANTSATAEVHNGLVPFGRVTLSEVSLLPIGRERTRRVSHGRSYYPDESKYSSIFPSSFFSFLLFQFCSAQHHRSLPAFVLVRVSPFLFPLRRSAQCIDLSCALPTKQDLSFTKQKNLYSSTGKRTRARERTLARSLARARRRTDRGREKSFKSFFPSLPFSIHLVILDEKRTKNYYYSTADTSAPLPS